MIKKLIQRSESLCLEFKSYWYGTNPRKPEDGWDELLKDFISMFNTYDKDQPKYIIFGYDEKTKKFNNFFERKNNKGITEINIIKNIEDLKNALIKSLQTTCDLYYESIDFSIQLDDFFELETVTESDKSILLLTIHPAPFYFILKRDLSDGLKKNTIPIRIIKENYEPRNAIASEQQVSALRKIINKNHTNIIKKEQRSIEKIVDAFKSKHFQSAIVKKISEERQKSGIYYQLFEISSTLMPPHLFIYITAFSSQERTISRIIEQFKSKFETCANIFILADRENRTGGKIDLPRIDSIFNKKLNAFTKKIAKSDYLEDFSREHIYKKELLENIFIVNPPVQNDYISPQLKDVQGNLIDSHSFLNEWIVNNDSPILVIQGVGGVGKTTVAKQFIYEMHKKERKSEDVKFLFINSHEIINQLMSRGKISDLFDFYQVLADIHETKDRFNKVTFSLSADNGNIIIVLDGIDEVIAKKGSDFDVIQLINSITTDYSNNLSKTKIIITCRNSFWSDDLVSENNINKIEIQPFDKTLANQYYQQTFSNDQKRIDKALIMASMYKSNDDYYVPYILDMIKEIISYNDEGLTIGDFNSELLKPEKSKHDYLIGKVCEREIKKLDNTSIDDQLQLFIDMTLRFSGSLSDQQLEEVLSKNLSQKNLTKFKSHPLLKEENGSLHFRYDFFGEYFKELALYEYLKDEEINILDLNSDLIDIINHNINYDNDFVKSLTLRTSEIDDYKEKIQILLIDAKSGINNSSSLIKNNIKNIISSLFILILTTDSQKNKESRTALLIDTFMTGNMISDLSLINLHSSNQKITFNFKGLKFNNCHFENFEDFLDCDFNKETSFKNSSFLPKLKRNNKVASSLSESNISTSTCKIDGLISYFHNKKNIDASKEESHDKFLRDVIRFFWRSMGFIELPQQSVRKKFKNNIVLLDKLVSLNFIKEKRLTTFKERQEPHYYISEEYDGIRKIMEENHTCLEFDRIKSEFLK